MHDEPSRTFVPDVSSFNDLELGEYDEAAGMVAIGTTVYLPLPRTNPYVRICSCLR